MVKQNLKHLKNVVIILGVWLVTSASLAQNAERIFADFEQRANGMLTINVNDGQYNIQFYTNTIVETTFIPKGEEFNPNSHAVVLKPQKVETVIEDKGNLIYYKSNGISVVVQKSPFQLSYNFQGKELISEKRGYKKLEKGEAIEMNLTHNEILYGGGARALGMNRRGHRLQLYNRAHYGYETHSELMNYTMPVVLSSKKYLIHFDNAPIGYLDLDSKKQNELVYETISGRKTYQIVAGNSWFDIVDSYTELTGKQPMLPRWALGNFSSRFGYHSQYEAEKTIEKFEENNIPVDAIILDLYWFGKDIKGTMGNLDVFRDSFPDFEGMVKRLHTKGVKTITITEPFILTTSKKWKEALDQDILAKTNAGTPATYDFYFGNTGIVDIYKEEGKQWFWNQYKKLAELGVAGVWGDLGEPEVHPDWVQHATGTADEVHNIYGHDWAGLVAKGYEKEYPNTRPFILMRAGYSGSQRFGMIPWSGDVNRTWGGLQSQPEIALQMGLQGLGYMHSDLGGFAGANLDDELYARWLQYGVFQPIFRPHAQEEVPSEPVFRATEAKERAKQAILLRYQLLPYNYNLVFENHTKGYPLMRPLFFEFENAETRTLASTYLWGNDFLVSPQLEKDGTNHQIYFPKNTVWFDFYTDERILGNGYQSIQQNKKNSIPTYVRAGAFIPKSKPMQNTELYHADEWRIQYYHDQSIVKSTRTFYNDNGKTAKAFEQGIFEIISLESSYKNEELRIKMSADIGKHYQAKTKNYTFEIHNITKYPKKITVAGKKVRGSWNKELNRLSIPVIWNTKGSALIKIKL